MSQAERYILLGIGSLISLGITAVICYLALTVTDTGERSILFGALIGTAGFGGGALFSMLGYRHGTGGPTVNVESPQAGGSVDVNANAAPAKVDQ